MNKPNNVLIFGANGQLGRWLIESFLEGDYFITGASRFSLHKDLSAKYLATGRYRFKLSDIQYPTHLESFIKEEKPDILVNAAGMSNPGSCSESRNAAIQTNVMGVFHLLDSIQKHAPNCKFVTLGSINEILPSRKHEFYSTTKQMSRDIVSHYRKAGIAAIQLYLGMNTSEYAIDDSLFVNRLLKSFKAIAQAIRYGQGFNVIKLYNIDEQRFWGYSKDTADKIANITREMTLEQSHGWSDLKIVGFPHSLREYIETILTCLKLDWIDTGFSYRVKFKDSEHVVVSYIQTESTISEVDELKLNAEFIRVRETPFSTMISKMINS